MKSAFAMQRRDAEFLYESDAAFITRDGDVIELNHFGPWTRDLTKLAKKHKINALHISETYQEEWPSLDFLLDLPPLRKLHVVLSRPANLSPITKLTALESLVLMGDVAQEKIETPVADFSKLTKLKQAYVEIAPPTLPLLECTSLQFLWAWNHCKPWLASLDLSRLTKLSELHVTAWAKLSKIDLSHQRRLEQLHVEALPKLKSVALDPKATLRRLKMGGCGPYWIDWDRMGDDLQELELSGPLRFPIEDVLRAPNLRKLETSSVRKFPPLTFLLRLPKLESFGYFTTPPGPKWSQEDEAVIRQIKARRA
jgi:hypothetical protein